MMLLLRCPGCKNTMKYQSKGTSLQGKAKRCVYCGKSYQVKSAVIKAIS